MVKVEVRMLKLDLIFITWNGIFVLPFMGCQSMAVFTSMEWGTLRVKCLTQEHNTITLTGWENDISWSSSGFSLNWHLRKAEIPNWCYVTTQIWVFVLVVVYFPSWHDQLSQTIRCSAQICAVISCGYGTSVLILQTSLHGETNGSIGTC